MARSTSSNTFDYQVFVSHATADKWIARMLCEKIVQAGASYFRDDDRIAVGDSIPEEIRKEIRRSREMLVLITPDSQNRPWVLAEVGAAWILRRRISVILCHTEIDAIPEGIKSDKAISINDTDDFLVELKRRVNTARNTHKKTAKKKLAKKSATPSSSSRRIRI